MRTDPKAAFCGIPEMLPSGAPELGKETAWGSPVWALAGVI